MKNLPFVNPEYEGREPLRIMLLGKSGAGKSSSGNTILGRIEFKADMRVMRVTRHCEKRKGTVKGVPVDETGKTEDVRVTVIDTPGFFEFDRKDEIVRDILKRVKLVEPGPHVFIFVVPVGRMTQEDQDTQTLIETRFGPKIWDYTIVLFTHGDRLEGKTINTMVSESDENFRNFIRKCSGGFHVFNNKDPQDQSQVTKLIEKIQTLVALNGNNYYGTEMYPEEERKIRERQENLLTERAAEIRCAEKQLEERYREKELQMRKEELWRKKEEDARQEAEKEMKSMLTTGSICCDMQLPEKMEGGTSEDKEEPSEGDEEEETQPSSAKRRKKRSKSLCSDEEEQAVSSTQTTPGQRKRSKKISFMSTLKKGEKGDIWTWLRYKTQLPVTCGLKEGMLFRRRLAKGEKCIFGGKNWFTPSQFEKHGGRGNCRNWKITIRCQDVPLGKLIQGGHLQSGNFRAKKAKQALFLSDDSNTVSEGDEEDEDQNEKETEEEEEDDEQPSTSRGAVASGDEDEEQTELQPSIGTGVIKVFSVTCEDKAGTLHVKRFASGDRGKSIRTETSWMTPVDFVKSASAQTNLSWRKAITWEGNPLRVLIEAEHLTIHSLLCKCDLCKPSSEEIENQKNDDECYICKIGDDEELVMCDQCPRSFHQKCHLPNVDDAILGDNTPWMCTFCTFRTTPEFLEEQEREAAMAQQISQHMLGCQYLLLSLLSADEDQTLTSNPYVKDYTSVIKSPMWLEKISDKLQSKIYKTVGEFVCDVQLMFTNCASFNRDNDEFLTEGNRLKDLFDKELNHVFNIREETDSH